MHTPLIEERRSSHLTRVPVLDIGPGGTCSQQLHAQGGSLVELPTPAPTPHASLQPRVMATSLPRRPWRWSHFFFGFLLSFVLAALGVLLILAILIALVFTPFVAGVQHAR